MRTTSRLTAAICNLSAAEVAFISAVPSSQKAEDAARTLEQAKADFESAFTAVMEAFIEQRLVRDDIPRVAPCGPRYFEDDHDS